MKRYILLLSLMISTIAGFSQNTELAARRGRFVDSISINGEWFTNTTIKKTVVTTIAALRSMSILSNPRTDQLYYVTDYGGHFFTWNSSSTATDNTGTIVKATAITTGRFVAVIEGNKVPMTWFGVVADGTTDNSATFSTAVSFMNTSQVGLRLPKGTIKIGVGYTIPTVTFGDIEGAGLTETFIKGPYLNSNSYVLFNLGSGAIFRARGISFQGLSRVTTSSQSVKELTIRECHFKDNRLASIFTSAVGDSANSIVTNGLLEYNIVDSTNGFELTGGVSNSMIVRNNKFNGLTRNQTYYPLPAHGTMGLYGVVVGDGNQLNRTVAQDLTNNVTIEGNIIKGMYNPGDTKAYGFNTTNGIMVTGRNVNVIGNIVTDLTNFSGTDAEGIYLKVNGGLVEGNTLINAAINDVGSGSISLKGSQAVDNAGNTLHLDNPIGKNIIVKGNTILNTISGGAANGIMTFGGSDYSIEGNLISGMTNWGINIVGGTITNGFGTFLFNARNNKIVNNYIKDCGGNFGIQLTAASIDGAQIENNTIKNLAGNSVIDKLIPIYVRASDATNGYAKDIIIKGNTINLDSIGASFSSGASFITVAPNLTSSNIEITDNKAYVASTTVTGSNKINAVTIAHGSGTATNVLVKGNSFAGPVLASPLFSEYYFGNNVNLYASASWLLNSKVSDNYVNQNIISKFPSVSDADYTLSAHDVYTALPVITANRVLTVSRTNIPNNILVIRNTNTSTSFSWSFPADGSVRDAVYTGRTTIPNQSVMTLQWDGFAWVVRSIAYAVGSGQLMTRSAAPTTSEIAASQWALYKNTTTGRAGLFYNDGGTIIQLVPTGSATITGDGTTTVFTITHSVGFTPGFVAPLSPTNAAAATALKLGYFISAKGATTFDVTFQTAPAAGSITFDWQVK